MTRDTQAECAEVALYLLGISLEYLVYYNYIIERPQILHRENIRDIIVDLLNYIEEEYYFDEIGDLQVPKTLDKIQKILIELIPEKGEKPNVQNPNWHQIK